MLTSPARLAHRLLAGVSLTVSLTLSAQTWSGAGSDDNFSTNANWFGGTAPANDGTATAVLNSTTRPAPVLDTDYSLDSLGIFGSGFTLGGTHSLTLATSLVKTNTGYIDFTANVPIILGGDISVGGAGTTGSIKLNGAISGTHGITFSGGQYAALYLGGENTFSGDLTVDGASAYLGTSRTVAAGSITGNVVLANGGSFTINRQGTFNFDQVVSGTGRAYGALVISGDTSPRDATTVTLTKQSTYSGGTSVTGTLVIGVADALPTTTTLALSSFGTIKLLANQTVGNNSGASGSLIDIGSGATFTANLTANSTTGGTTGAGSVALTGAYDLQTYEPWDHTGGTTITDTNLIIGSGYGFGGLAGDVVNNGRVTINKNISITYADNMSGTGTLTKLNANTLTLTGTNTHANTTVSQGTLNIGTGGTTGSISGNIALSSGTTLKFNRSDASSYDGVLSGTGTVGKYGAGTLTFGNTNTVVGALSVYSGRLIASATNALGDTAVTISSGTLEIGADQSIRSLNGDYGTLQFDAGSTLTLTSNNSSSIKSSLTGTGNLIKQGTGYLTLTHFGGATVDGTITAQQGDLFATGTYSSAALAIASGAAFSVGSLHNSGSASFESASFAGGSTLTFSLSKANGSAGLAVNGWDLLTTSGGVTLGGTAGDPITLAIESLNGAGSLGATANFDFNTDYSWNLITGNGGITGFDANTFTIDTTNFTEAANVSFTGALSVNQIGNSLYLNYTAASSAVPEPSTYALLFGAFILAFSAVQRRRLGKV